MPSNHMICPRCGKTIKYQPHGEEPSPWPCPHCGAEPPEEEHGA